MKRHATIYAALLQPESRTKDLRPCLDAAARVLADRDPRRDGPPFRLPLKGAVHGDSFAIRLSHQSRSIYGPRLVIEVMDRRGADVESAAELLAEVVLETLRTVGADTVEWMQPGTLIDRDDFIALRSYRSMHKRARPQTPYHAAWTASRPSASRGKFSVAQRAVQRWIEANTPYTKGEAGTKLGAWLAIGALATVAPVAAAVLLVFGLIRVPSERGASAPEAFGLTTVALVGTQAAVTIAPMVV